MWTKTFVKRFGGLLTPHFQMKRTKHSHPQESLNDDIKIHKMAIVRNPQHMSNIRKEISTSREKQGVLLSCLYHMMRA